MSVSIVIFTTQRNQQFDDLLTAKWKDAGSLRSAIETGIIQFNDGHVQTAKGYEIHRELNPGWFEFSLKYVFEKRVL